MTEAPPGIPPDAALPGAHGLLGERGVRAVADFLSARRWTLEEARPVQAFYRPGRECLVRYRVRARTPEGWGRRLSISAEVRARPETPAEVGAELGRRYGLPDPVEAQGAVVVWAFPYDPSMAALPAAAWGPDVRAALGPGTAAVSVQPLRYRPRRRAVFRYRLVHGRRGGSGTLFGKVLRPSRERRAVRAAEGARRRAPRALPRPRVRLAVPFERRGILFTAPERGRSLRDLLLLGASLPAPERVAALLDEVPRLVRAGGEGASPDPRRVARSTVAQVARLVPDAEADALRILEVVEASWPDGIPERPVHGDLYEAQVFVDEDFSLGLIDLDDLGPGDPAADAANFCAHLVALALAVPSASTRLLAYRTLVRRAFLAGLDLSASGLAWREALTMLRLALGPFRVLRPTWSEDVRTRVRVALRLLSSR